MTDFKSGVGSNIKFIRKAKDITQEELAEIIGIHPRQLSKIETGEHFPSCRTFEKICAALDIEPQSLFDFEFLVDESLSIMTGTDSTAYIQASKTGNDNVYELKPNKNSEEAAPKSCTDESMSKTAKTLNKPLFVEYFENGKVSKVVVFYPDGKEKVIKKSQDVELKQNLNYLVNKLRKIAKDKKSMDYARLALDALDDNDALKKLDGAIYGMKLARGIE